VIGPVRVRMTRPNGRPGKPAQVWTGTVEAGNRLRIVHAKATVLIPGDFRFGANASEELEGLVAENLGNGWLLADREEGVIPPNDPTYEDKPWVTFVLKAVGADDRVRDALLDALGVGDLPPGKNVNAHGATWQRPTRKPHDLQAHAGKDSPGFLLMQVAALAAPDRVTLVDDKADTLRPAPLDELVRGLEAADPTLAELVYRLGLRMRPINWDAIAA
jgi:hypothetical protein